MGSLALALIFLQPPMDGWRLERERAGTVGRLTRPVRLAAWRWVASWSIWRRSMAEKITFGGIDRHKLDEAITRLAAAGIPVSGDAGEVTRDGYTVRYSYNEAAGELTLILVRKPLLVPASMVRRRLKAELAKEGISERA